MPPLPETALLTAHACADAARHIALQHFRTPLAADAKSDESPVTIADRQAEQAMRTLIAKAFPDHAVLGEEFGHDTTTSDWQWVLDPIDGTRAYITGRPTFGTLIALLHNGIPVLGLIDQPVTRERWIGITGQKTTYQSTLPGRIGTRPLPSLAHAELSCTSPDMLAGPYEPRFSTLKNHTKRTYWGGDCYAYGLLALGQIDAIAECTMKIWDWAALVPIVTGAGGSMTDWQGQPLTAQSDGTVLALGDPSRLPDAIAHLRAA